MGCKGFRPARSKQLFGRNGAKGTDGMRKASLHWMAIVTISLSAAVASGCALFTTKHTGMALQLDQEYMAPSSGVSLHARINGGHRYFCQTFFAGRDGSLAALSVDIGATRFRRISRRDPTIHRTLLLPARLFPQYNLSISLFSVHGDTMHERLLDFQIPCDSANFECDYPGHRTLDTVILLPKHVKQRRGQKYAICAYYPDAPWSAGGIAVGSWVGGVATNGDQKIVCGDDGIHWDFRCVPDRSLNFRTYTVSTCEERQNLVDEDPRSIESAIAIIQRQSVYSERGSKLHQAFIIGASLDDVSLILGRRPDKCEGIEPRPMLGVKLNADGAIASLSKFGAGAKSGLSAGERIVMVNGIHVSNAEEVVEAMRTTVSWDEISTVSTEKKTYSVHFDKPSKALECSWNISEDSSMQTGESAAGKHGKSVPQAAPPQTDSGHKRVFHASCRFDDGRAVVCYSNWVE